MNGMGLVPVHGHATDRLTYQVMVTLHREVDAVGKQLKS